MQCDKCWSYDCKNILVIGLICLKILPISYLSSCRYMTCTVKTKQCSLPFSPAISSPFLLLYEFLFFFFFKCFIIESLIFFSATNPSSHPETFF